jgi:hypothetical protein
MQRRLHAAKALAQERIRQLEALPGWTWNSRSSRWEQNFEAARNFAMQQGTSVLVRHARDSAGNRVGLWLQTQRYKEKSLSQSQKQLLESLPEWTWDTRDLVILARISELREFQKVNQRVEVEYKENPGLHSYLRKFRANPKKYPAWASRMFSEIPGWTFDTAPEPFFETISELRVFVRQHKRLPSRSSSKQVVGKQEAALARFVSWNRWLHSKGRLEPERVLLLSGLPGWSWNARDDQWEIGLKQIKHFVKIFGSSRVPQPYVTKDGYALGAWVGTKRLQYKNESLSPERIAALESLPGWEWKPRRGKAGREGVPEKLRR